jgi:hypothetical protein
VLPSTTAGYRAVASFSQVERDQRRRARRVDGHGRPFEPERVRDAAGRDARRAAGDEVSLQFGRAVLQPAPVVVVHDAREDAGEAAAQCGGVDAGAFDGFPGGFEEESLLWVDGEGFAWADAEEGGVEVVGVVQEAAFPRVGLAGLRRIGVVQALHVPAAPGREAGDRVLTAGDEVPQQLR